MKFRIGMGLLIAVLGSAASAAGSSKPVLREGKSVTMAVSSQAVEMRGADDENAPV
jgi:hypothetical protein